MQETLMKAVIDMYVRNIPKGCHWNVCHKHPLMLSLKCMSEAY